MNEKIVTANGIVFIVGGAGSVSGVIARLVRENTTPAVYADGEMVTPEIVPEAATVAVQVTEDELKTHPWRIPTARRFRLEDIRAMRDQKLIDRDAEVNHSLSGRPGTRQVEFQRQRQIIARAKCMRLDRRRP